MTLYGGNGDAEARREIRRALDAYFAEADARPSQKAAILARTVTVSRTAAVARGATIAETANRPRARRKAAWAVALAALLTLALGGAIASGLGLFGLFGAQSEGGAQRLEHLDEASRAIGATVESAQGFTLTLEQAYCDADKLYFAYTLTGERAGFTLGDGAALPDGTTLTVWDSGARSEDGYTTRGYQEVELPPGAKAGETLDIVLTVIEWAEDARFHRVPFTVPVSRARKARGEAALSDYTARAELTVSAVEVYGTVTITAPNGWPKGSSGDEDRVCDYVLIADGEELYAREAYAEEEGGGRLTLSLRYDLPKSARSLSLRPVRYLSGDTPTEEIVLEQSEERSDN